MKQSYLLILTFFLWKAYFGSKLGFWPKNYNFVVRAEDIGIHKVVSMREHCPKHTK